MSVVWGSWRDSEEFKGFPWVLTLIGVGVLNPLSKAGWRGAGVEVVGWVGGWGVIQCCQRVILTSEEDED